MLKQLKMCLSSLDSGINDLRKLLPKIHSLIIHIIDKKQDTLWSIYLKKVTSLDNELWYCAVAVNSNYNSCNIQSKNYFISLHPQQSKQNDLNCIIISSKNNPHRKYI